MRAKRTRGHGTRRGRKKHEPVAEFGRGGDGIIFLKFHKLCGSDRVEEVRRSGADGCLCGARESGGTGAK